MDRRIVQFIAGLRAAGVRVSLAESQDAFLATQVIGVIQRETFKAALKTTLVKDKADGPVFDQLFPLYFGSGGPPFTPASEALSPDDMDLLRVALKALAGQLHELLERMLEGKGPTPPEMRRALENAGLNSASSPRDQLRLADRALRQLGLEEILEQIEALLARLVQLGMGEQALEQLRALIQSNARVLREQVEAQIGAGLAERMAEPQFHNPKTGDLMDQPFQMLNEREIETLRREVGRLAARLRTQLALRQKRGKGHRLDAKGTLRANVRYGGVPFEIMHKLRRRKARFTVICDVSTSMRPAVSFLLLMIYQIQDQVARTRSFAFIDHIREISGEFAEDRPEIAIPKILRRMPPGHYNTDLGRCLRQFIRQHLDAIDSRTTVVFCGDGRNNYHDPHTDLVEMVGRRARRVVWFTPEPSRRWGTGDSDMLAYAPLVDAVFQVSNLRQLTSAVDQLFR